MIKASDLIERFRFALENRWGYIWGTAGILWTGARQRALEATTDEDRKSGREYGAKWIGHHVADCSGLFHWAFDVLGGYMYHGSNTMWDKYCAAQGELRNGQRTDGQTLKPGTAVFVYNSQKKRRSHVGLYIGNGHVIEASGTVNGVIMGKITNRKWNEWGELKGVEFDIFDVGGVTVIDTQTETRPTLRRGSKGEYVTLLQSMLVNRGYDVGTAGIDGDFGKATQAAVVAFQRDNYLALDGIVGPNTWKALDSAAERVKTYYAMITGLTKDETVALLKAYPTANIIEEV